MRLRDTAINDVPNLKNFCKKVLEKNNFEVFAK